MSCLRQSVKAKHYLNNKSKIKDIYNQDKYKYKKQKHICLLTQTLYNKLQHNLIKIYKVIRKKKYNTNEYLQQNQ